MILKVKVSSPEERLKKKIISDLRKLELPIDEVDLSLRPFSKTYYGKYYPVNDKSVRPRLWIYPYVTKENDFLPYSRILDTGIHEMCHHIQHTDPNFERAYGVMHNEDFWKLFQSYHEKAVENKIIKE